MKVVGFGDMLVCLSTPGNERFIQANNFGVNYSGAEANVCVSLSMLGIETDFITRLPRNEISACAVACLRKYGVGTNNVVYGGERIGVMYVENGASQRPSKVVYDRMHTAICEAERKDFDWDSILDGAGIFHFTGITAALSPNMPFILLDALKCAKAKGIRVTCDLNFRKKLWSSEKAIKTMAKLVPYADLLIGNEEDAEKALGIKHSGFNVEKGILEQKDYINVAEQIYREFGVEMVAFSLRDSRSASDNGWAGMLYCNGKTYFSRKFEIHLVDRIGGGDAFSAGLIYGIGAGYDSQKAIEFAVAASCLKQTIHKDFNLSTLEEIESLMHGFGSGRIQR